MDVELYKNRAR